MAESPVSLSGAVAAEGDARLPRPPGVFRRFWARHPRALDTIIASVWLLVAGGTATGVGVAGGLPGWSWWVLPILAGNAWLLLRFRRSSPVLVLGVTWIVALAQAGLLGLVDFTATGIALYAVAVYRSSRAAWIGLAATVAVVFTATSLAVYVTILARDAGSAGARGPNPELPGDIGIGTTSASTSVVVLLLIVTLVGTNIGNRRRYLDALIDRAGQLARERDQQAIIAAAAERARIAREMHDIVSHSLTVMITLADGSAATVPNDPDRSAVAMRRVAETGRDALGDMRRMLGVLAEHPGPAAPSGANDRGPATGRPSPGTAVTPAREAELGIEAEFTPQPGAAELEELVSGFRRAGLAVVLETSGAPPLDRSLQLAVYRIVQESLTNTLRHAGPAASAHLIVAFGTHSITIAVDDDGVHGSGPVTVAAGAGRGLVGMRERAALYGGTLEAGARRGGGWRVFATIPVPTDAHADARAEG